MTTPYNDNKWTSESPRVHVTIEDEPNAAAASELKQVTKAARAAEPGLTNEDLRQGVTAGYDHELDRWHLEVHRTGQPVEIVPIATPAAGEQETARAAAEQHAEHLGYRYIENNTGLTPASDLVDRIRGAAWMQGEDDPALLEEIVRLRDLEQDAINLGWTLVTEPVQTGEQAGMIRYDAAGVKVIAATGIVGADTTGPISCTPDMARALGAALIVAAKQAEDLAARTQ